MPLLVVGNLLIHPVLPTRCPQTKEVQCWEALSIFFEAPIYGSALSSAQKEGNFFFLLKYAYSSSFLLRQEESSSFMAL